MEYSKLPEKIKFRRIELGITLSELAEKAMMSKAHLSNIETGKINNVHAKTIHKLASALQVKPLWLIDNKSEVA